MSATTDFVQDAKAEISRLDNQILELQQRRAVTAARLEGYEIAQGHAPAPSHVYIQQPRRPTITQPAPKHLTKAPRAPAGSWGKVFRSLLAGGKTTFNYEAVVTAAIAQDIKATKPSTRVRVSKFKDMGYLERVDEGVYQVTDAGREFFERA